MLHGIATRTNGVEGDDFVACFLKEVDGVHRSFGEDTEIGHADDSFGGGLGNTLLGLSHAPRGGGGIGEDLAGENVEAKDVGNGEHHGDILDADEGRGVAGSGGGKHDFREAIREGLQNGGAG